MKRTLTQKLGLLGVLSFLSYAAAVVLAPLAYPGYDWMAQAVSDLSGAYRGVPDSLYNITAVHIPQLWGQIADAGYGDLTLAGHVHSMQIKLRLFGRAFSPAQLLYTRWSGRYDEGGRTLYINDGTGYVVFPMRLGAYPEITLITLRRCE